MKKELISTETESYDLFLATFLVKALQKMFGNNFEKEKGAKNRCNVIRNCNFEYANGYELFSCLSR